MSYFPCIRDLIWIDLHSQAGKELTKRRPFLVISPNEYNRKVGLVIDCPITSKIKGYPFEVSLPTTIVTKGCVLADQIKSLDWRKRKAAFIEKIDEDTFTNTLSLINTLLCL